ncbi:hypothetical protein D6D20_09620 [Aureobasidium pullulans]|uniref:Apple domain-containing protein n=1 Tax=Aureobasidium pullulans TaxID=5580 RepID=A0A4S8YTQ2_AURPU|nr:hypothetical protein D6D20_09620 [Aureobasidium pullulans]
MRALFGLALASTWTAATALAFNGTTETITVTHTSWSTIDSCPAPQTVTVCDPGCAAPTSISANKANVVYQTVSDCQAGQVVNIDGTPTTLAQATALSFETTISNFVFIPGSATGNDYTASATLTNVVYPSSMTGYSGQVVTCQTGITTISSNGVVLSNCPCTVQSTVLELTATGVGALPTAVVSSGDYIVKIIYVYVIEVIVEQVPTTITKTATSILTTTQTELVTTTNGAETTIQTESATATTSALPTIVTVEDVVFLLDYNTAYDGVAAGGLRKRQAISLPSVPAPLTACLAECAEQASCQAVSFVESFSSCIPLTQFTAQSRRVSPGEIFATVILRPSVPTSSVSPTNTATPSSSGSSMSLGSSSSSSIPSSLERSATPSSSRVTGTTATPSSSKLSTTVSSSATTDSTSASLSSKLSSNIGSSSALYPISNTSVSSTSLSSRSSSRISVSASVTSSSVISVSSVSSSSETSSSLSSAFSSSNSSTIVSPTSARIPSSTVTASSSISSVVAVDSSSTSSTVFSSLSSIILSSSSSSTTSSAASSTTSSAASSKTSSTSTTSAAPLTGCAVASGISGYDPAIAYCASAYPVTTYTTLLNATITNFVTNSAPTSTVYSNLTLPIETTVQTDQETIYVSSTFSTESTIVDTTTTTMTVTVTALEANTVVVQKRQAAPSVQASIFSSIMSRPASDIALVCSCLQTPATTSVTSTETVLTTTIATPIASANNTITPPVVTVQTTETAFVTEVISVTDYTSTTTTETSMATATVAPSCTNLFNCRVEQSIDVQCSSAPGQSSLCTCFEVAKTGQGFCSSAVESLGQCETQSDCGSGDICVVNTCQGSVCLPGSDAACVNPGGLTAARRRFRRTAAHRSIWNPLLSRYIDIYTDPTT